MLERSSIVILIEYSGFDLSLSLCAKPHKFLCFLCVCLLIYFPLLLFVQIRKCYCTTSDIKASAIPKLVIRANTITQKVVSKFKVDPGIIREKICMSLQLVDICAQQIECANDDHLLEKTCSA